MWLAVIRIAPPGVTGPLDFVVGVVRAWLGCGLVAGDLGSKMPFRPIAET